MGGTCRRTGGYQEDGPLLRSPVGEEPNGEEFRLEGSSGKGFSD